MLGKSPLLRSNNPINLNNIRVTAIIIILTVYKYNLDWFGYNFHSYGMNYEYDCTCSSSSCSDYHDVGVDDKFLLKSKW